MEAVEDPVPTGFVNQSDNESVASSTHSVPAVEETEVVEEAPEPVVNVLQPTEDVNRITEIQTEVNDDDDELPLDIEKQILKASVEDEDDDDDGFETEDEVERLQELDSDADESDSDDEFFQETVGQRIAALADIVHPQYREYASAVTGLTQSVVGGAFSLSAKAFWVVSTSMLVLGVPWALAYSEDQQLMEMEKQEQMHMMGNEVLTQGPIPTPGSFDALPGAQEIKAEA